MCGTQGRLPSGRGPEGMPEGGGPTHELSEKAEELSPAKGSSVPQGGLPPPPGTASRGGTVSFSDSRSWARPESLQPFLPTTPMAMKMGISWITYTMVYVEREEQASMSKPLAPAQTRLGMPGGPMPLRRVQTPGEETGRLADQTACLLAGRLWGRPTLLQVGK